MHVGTDHTQAAHMRVKFSITDGFSTKICRDIFRTGNGDGQVNPFHTMEDMQQYSSSGYQSVLRHGLAIKNSFAFHFLA